MPYAFNPFTGNLDYYQEASASGISALTGDVTASGSGSVAATVAQVGGKTAAAVATSVDDTLGATTANTASKIVKRDASGNFTAGRIIGDTAVTVGAQGWQKNGTHSTFEGNYGGSNPLLSYHYNQITVTPINGFHFNWGWRVLSGVQNMCGTATLVGGTVTVANTYIRTGAYIYLSCKTPGGTQGFLSAPVSGITSATSFVINSTSGTDTSTVDYMIINTI